jgi:prevent-host-death family protein
MVEDIPELNSLPRQSASDVKNKWRDLVNEVQKSGSVAVTNHSKVEVVLVDAQLYQHLFDTAAAMKARERSVLERLSGDFEKRLASMQQPGFALKVASVLASEGKLRSRPKAGSSY